METIKLTQWLVKAEGKDFGLYTPLNCDALTAMAIAAAMFGSGVTALEEEGAVRERLNFQQVAIADPRHCAECGCFRSHEEGCSKEVTDAKGS